MNGWIRLYRQLEGWEWYSCPLTKAVFIHLLIKASWRDARWRGIEIPRGSLFCSVGTLSAATGVSTRSVRTALERLKSTGEVTIQTTSRGTLVTLCKWDDYNSDENENDKPNDKPNDKRPTNDRQATDKRSTTSEEGKEGKKGKKERSKSMASKARPHTREEFDAYFREVGLYPRDAEATWNKWEGNGWKNGGKAIVCWKSTVQAWKASGYMPSLKSPSDYERQWPSEPSQAAEPEEDDLMANYLRLKEEAAREAAGDHPDFWTEEEREEEEAGCF